MIITVGIITKVAMLHPSIGWNAKNLVSPVSAKPFQSTHLSRFGISNFLCTIKLYSDKISSEPYLLHQHVLESSTTLWLLSTLCKSWSFWPSSSVSDASVLVLYRCCTYSCPCMTHFHIFDPTSLRSKSWAASCLAINRIKNQVRGWSVCCSLI